MLATEIAAVALTSVVVAEIVKSVSSSVRQRWRARQNTPSRLSKALIALSEWQVYAIQLRSKLAEFEVAEEIPPLPKTDIEQEIIEES